uniref:Enhancer of rudimentary homolog n=1 Tax=Tetraselmis sp. GSL018 TaxID=582737 RepID=A0A061RH26_9CHLO|eukprot:CAMPEP_0177578254 /NCGR_PEP_ID=MMETSP0419_2-20121207/243_1 /TAXON_ID=582737 /ORGANISM="Tetraselmis sp., Strain GSL018" /LENGTH=103 /DNA_ID=CAMNT_0019066671 /DNA_START=82 /DNA_END=393 /DNA_ORIENTATION=+
MAENRHTILLIQTSPSPNTRTYRDYESISGAVDGVCQIFEQKLKELNPQLPNITYDVSDLFNYIDSLRDLSALVFDNKSLTYEPHDKEWIKSRVFAHLRKQVS